MIYSISVAHSTPADANRTVAHPPNATPTNVTTPTPHQESIAESADSTPVLSVPTKTLQPWAQEILVMKTLPLSSALEGFIMSKPDDQALQAMLGEDDVNQELGKGKFP